MIYVFIFILFTWLTLASPTALLRTALWLQVDDLRSRAHHLLGRAAELRRGADVSPAEHRADPLRHLSGWVVPVKGQQIRDL